MIDSKGGVNHMIKKETVDVQQRIAEIERLISDFKEKFEAGTADVDNFITINEIEQLWSKLRRDTDNVYSDIMHDLMNSVDETDLIRKKKLNTETKESNSEPINEI